jgi:hypothetical protein
MSHSTHVGFSAPPVTLASRPETSFVSFGLDPPGVGQRWTSRPSKLFVGTLAQLCAEPSFQSRLVGVGHMLGVLT